MKRIVTVLGVVFLLSCQNNSQNADGGYAKDSVSGNVNNVSGTRSGPADTLYKDSVRPTGDTVHNR